MTRRAVKRAKSPDTNTRKRLHVATHEDDHSAMSQPLSNKIVNLTPHDIHVHGDDGKIITYPKSGQIARLNTAEQKLLYTSLSGVPVYTPQEFIGVYFPEVTRDVDAIIVSMPTGNYMRQLNKERTDFPPNWKSYDVLGPDMGPGQAVRDEKTGQPIGTRRLVLYTQNTYE